MDKWLAVAQKANTVLDAIDNHKGTIPIDNAFTELLEALFDARSTPHRDAATAHVVRARTCQKLMRDRGDDPSVRASVRGLITRIRDDATPEN